MGREVDAMICRSCGLEERASEGYPCENCGTFICILCTLRGVKLCRNCSAGGTAHAPGADAPGDDTAAPGD